jgi:hypothetical protein
VFGDVIVLDARVPREERSCLRDGGPPATAKVVQGGSRFPSALPFIAAPGFKPGTCRPLGRGPVPPGRAEVRRGPLAWPRVPEETWRRETLGRLYRPSFEIRYTVEKGAEHATRLRSPRQRLTPGQGVSGPVPITLLLFPGTGNARRKTGVLEGRATDTVPWERASNGSTATDHFSSGSTRI